jgi:hypothetical protein
MPADRDVEELFERLRPHADALRSRMGGARPDTAIGLALGCLPTALLAGVLLVSWSAWSGHPYFFPALGAAAAIAGVLSFIGLRFWDRGRAAQREAGAAGDDELLRPLAEGLVPGGAFSRPDPASGEWRPSLLFPRTADVLHPLRRISGRIAGMPALLDEIVIRYNPRFGVFQGWVVRFELPFAVAGHLRIRVPRTTHGFHEWMDGFEPEPEAEARLSAEHAIDVAPPGSTPAGAEAATETGGISPQLLLTDALLDALRSIEPGELAIAGRSLWITAPGVGTLGSLSFDLASLRAAAGTLDRVERTAREVLRAGGAHR